MVKNYGNCVQVIQVIKTTLKIRGDGKKTPLRVVTQYWSFDGDLLAENDPCPNSEGAEHG